MPGNPIPGSLRGASKMIRRTAATAKNTAVFFLAVVRAFNPLSYQGIIQNALKPAVTHVLYLLLLVVLLTAAVALPQIASINKEAYDAIGRFSRITVSAEVATKQPIISELAWLGSARVFVNTTADAKKTSGYDIVVTSDSIRTRPLLCMLTKFGRETCNLLGLGQSSTPIKNIDLASSKNRDGTAGIISALMILMLPGLLILYYFSLAAKYAALAVAATILGYLIIKLSKRNTGFLDALKIATYALTVPIVLDFTISMLRNSLQAISPTLLDAAPITAYTIIIISAVIFNDVRNAVNPMN